MKINLKHFFKQENQLKSNWKIRDWEKSIQGSNQKHVGDSVTEVGIPCPDNPPLSLIKCHLKPWTCGDNTNWVMCISHNGTGEVGLIIQVRIVTAGLSRFHAYCAIVIPMIWWRIDDFTAVRIDFTNARCCSYRFMYIGDTIQDISTYIGHVMHDKPDDIARQLRVALCIEVSVIAHKIYLML
jgi:hypothetical protein